ncbi:trace amine-associated receptor 7d-like isoform X1 [Montipora capricornis]|uniref:trace amine-associated receptor 7d-like isoform X1 n=2 Tax=Montipora foliosa TaxID=591990 RepID=UPI0035F17BF8
MAHTVKTLMDNSTVVSPTNHSSPTSCNIETLSADSYHYGLNIFIIALNIPFAIFAVLVNLAVIITVYKTLQLRSPANILLCSLAFLDFLVGLVTQPLFISWRLMLHYPSTVCQSKVIHTLYEAFLFLCVGGSFFCLAYVSTDRTMAVSKPLRYRARVTTEKTICNLVILFVIWITFIAVRYSGIDEKTNQLITSVIAGILVLYLLLVHVALIIKIKRNNVHTLHAEENSAMIAYKRERRCAITIIYIFLALLVFLVPAVLVQIITGFTSTNQSRTELNFAISALLINSSVNPLIYFWRSKDMRRAAKHLFVGTGSHAGGDDGSRAGNSGRSQEESL